MLVMVSSQFFFVFFFFQNGQTPLQLLAHQASIGREKQNSVLKIAQLLISLRANVNLKDKVRSYRYLVYTVYILCVDFGWCG